MPPSGRRLVSGSFLTRSAASSSSSSFYSASSSLSVDTFERPAASLPRTPSDSSPAPKSRRSSVASTSPGARRSPKPSPAVDRASETIVRRLLASGVSVHSTQAAKSLAAAAKTGEISLVRALVNAGVPVDAVHHDATALMAAARAGQLEVVQFLARHRADVEWRRPDGATALYLACKGGHADVVAYLLHRKASADVAVAFGKSALHVAVQGGHAEIVAELLRHWASTQRRDGAGKKAREYVAADCQEIAEMIDEFDCKTALLVATASGDLETVQNLIARGDDLETCGPEDETPLLVAARGGSTQVEIARALLAAGADRAAALKDGSSALHLAVRAAGARGGEAMVNLLLQEGIDPRSLDARGNTAHDYADDPYVVRALDRHDSKMKLLFAAEAGNLSLVIHHATHGAGIDTRGREDGVTPLLVAVQKGCIDIARFLLSKGADPNAASTVGGQAPLHVAAEQGNYDILETLLHYGADVNLSDTNGKLARDYAVDNQVVEMLDRRMNVTVATGRPEDENQNFAAENVCARLKLRVNSDQNKNAGSKSLPLLAGKKESMYEDEVLQNSVGLAELKLGMTTKLILTDKQIAKEHGTVSSASCTTDELASGITSKWSCSEPPPSYLSYMRVQPASMVNTNLLVAVKSNDLETAGRLLALDVDIEVRSEDNSFTPMCWAAHAGNLEMVQLLLVEGAQVNTRTPSGFSPLLLAASGGHATVVQQLLMKGADPEACIARSGFTALLVASFNGYIDVVQHLIRKRVNLEVQSADGSTALHLAVEKGHAAVVQLLLAGGSDPNALIQRDGSTALHKAVFTV
ncbi:unnamed protein product [Phytophthora fragariaefolia]|uniref:Unnamed protein product n=1 Tax=Phytophthora fragariaefolia TaxID=1490495 RepID=A0A9W7D0P3_9STRA|nr:unnamed protein product [Phytophthora fragariaefolia]